MRFTGENVRNGFQRLPEPFQATSRLSCGVTRERDLAVFKAELASSVAWDEVGVVDPDLKVTLPGHVILQGRHGIYIIENLFLEVLTRDQHYEFTFICLPLKLRGAIGSPVRPVAIAS